MHAFDTLGYAKRLRDAGVDQKVAEAHAEAARDFIMVELVTKTDLEATKQELRRAIDTATETLSLRLTVRLGALLAGGIAILAAIQRLV